jgi:hypothetical protein
MRKKGYWAPRISPKLFQMPEVAKVEMNRTRRYPMTLQFSWSLSAPLLQLSLSYAISACSGNIKSHLSWCLWRFVGLRAIVHLCIPKPLLDHFTPRVYFVLQLFLFFLSHGFECGVEGWLSGNPPQMIHFGFDGSSLCTPEACSIFGKGKLNSDISLMTITSAGESLTCNFDSWWSRSDLCQGQSCSWIESLCMAHKEEAHALLHDVLKPWDSKRDATSLEGNEPCLSAIDGLPDNSAS